jgi:hypothetical protein
VAAGRRRRFQAFGIRLLYGLEPGAKAPEVGLDGLAVGADRGFEARDRDRQPRTARDDAEHDRVDHGARLLRQRIHVEEEMLLCMVLHRLDQAWAVVAAVAHRHPLDHQVAAGGRGDHQRAVGRDEARRDGAAGFHKLARHHDINIADPRRERQHRAIAAELAPRRGNDLDVIGGGAGALRHSRNRGRLHGKAQLRRRRDDPVRKHAAPLAAERGDEDGERPGRQAGHARASAFAPPSQPMTVRRTRCSARSHQFGLRMISAR